MLTSVHLDLRRVRLKHSGKIVLWFPGVIRKGGGKCVLQAMKATKTIFTVESKMKNFSEYFFIGR